MHFDSRRKHDRLVHMKARHSSSISNRGRVHSLLQESKRYSTHEATVLRTQHDRDPATTPTNGLERSNQTIENRKISLEVTAYRTPIPLPTARSQQQEPMNNTHTGKTKPSQHPNQNHSQSHDHCVETAVDRWNKWEKDMIICQELSK